MKNKKRLLVILILAGVLAAVCAVGLFHIFAVYLPDVREQEEWTRMVQEYREQKYVAYAAENERYADYEVDVAFLGDSLTDGYDLAHYYPQYVTSNRGIGGDTTFDVESRLAVSVYDLKPKVVVLLIGTNNLDTMFDNYEKLLIGLKENLPDTKVVLMSLTVVGEGWGNFERKNRQSAWHNVRIEALAGQYGYTFVDLFSPLYDLETDQIKREYTTDGGHLTAKGYEVFTATLTPVLARILG